MEIPIVIEGIRCSAHCGVTESERRQPQPILVDLELHCCNGHAANSDDLTDTVDYGNIVERVIEISATSQHCLLESLAQHISQNPLFQEFPISYLKAWVRKTAPPLDHIDGSVGVRLSQNRAQITNQQMTTEPHSEPSAFLLEHYPKLSPGRWLDVAAGYGRNAIYLAAQGFSVVGIDQNEQALAHAQKLSAGLSRGQFTTHIYGFRGQSRHSTRLRQRRV